mmetsp:Transcript_20836/g.48927  ORF Transcript_20836/g.48927 Transcript_20836/m.48927 type:complete len:859 (-) Transcript_20836:58-2634(-)
MSCQRSTSNMDYQLQPGPNKLRRRRMREIDWKNVNSSLRRPAVTANSTSLKEDSQDIFELMSAECRMEWMRSFRDLDPRFQILNFFNELSIEGVDNFELKDGSTDIRHIPMVLRYFARAGMFTVWRPTSKDAIRHMITNEGCGKGLDIKGKSAKKGIYSGFVPFMQIHEEKHKTEVGTMKDDSYMRIFYPNRQAQAKAGMRLESLAHEMKRKAQAAQAIIELETRRREDILDGLLQYSLVDLDMSLRNVSRTTDDAKSCRRRSFAKGNPLSTESLSIRDMLMDETMDNIDDALEDELRYSMEDYTVERINTYSESQGVYGLLVPEKLFWEGFVVQHTITREENSNYDFGRPSMPEFQKMNLDTFRVDHALRQTQRDTVENNDPRPVLWHAGCGKVGQPPPADFDVSCNPLNPQDLLIAYEENGKVIPVVSDFDCFLLGTRGVKYRDPLGENEVTMLNWCIDEIRGILETPDDDAGWTQRWLGVKKRQLKNGESRQMPKFGYADPRSYAIMRGAVNRLRGNGSVRHGPECFNYGFPQELDDEFLVISDDFVGAPWRYTDINGLLEILKEKIDQGFTFPLNPKWVLADKGWKEVYDKLLSSQKPNVQDSLSIWYPQEVRSKISEISTLYPEGFRTCAAKSRGDSAGVLFDLAQLELRRYKMRLTVQKKFRRAVSSCMLPANIESSTVCFVQSCFGDLERRTGGRSLAGVAKRSSGVSFTHSQLLDISETCSETSQPGDILEELLKSGNISSEETISCEENSSNNDPNKNEYGQMQRVNDTYDEFSCSIKGDELPAALNVPTMVPTKCENGDDDTDRHEGILPPKTKAPFRTAFQLAQTVNRRLRSGFKSVSNMRSGTYPR